ncbi:hypothetical protein [Candidatus Methanodesulfokora washburnensis]|jgi:hypothetical protein|uniref:Uncharacterized protein n=1 Tax=Candidatus Methanodesulfokora washburnensis TaxID=2478471 RepID=A0A3R9QAW4_9CREN|nr:hypothetical protein [Candidatus Methanodesulfokores washburnensis]RSN71716.1 hypothetical protein D6D85_15395 [Candidatus Methanodesulfokores washburnensis]
MREKLGVWFKRVGIFAIAMLLLSPTLLVPASPPQGKEQPLSTTCYWLSDYDETDGYLGYAWALVGACRDPYTHWLTNRVHDGGGGSYGSGYIVSKSRETEPFWELYRAYTKQYVRIYSSTGVLLEVDIAYAEIRS